jgi:GntR family transcriptional regulator/MocR family aminotransferase
MLNVQIETTLASKLHGPARRLDTMQIPVHLDRSGGETLTAQLVAQFREAIRHGRIAPGARLPSSRRMSEQLDISRNTVVRAYETLEMEGYVETRPASGIFAATDLPDSLIRPISVPAEALPHDPDTVMPEPLTIARAQKLTSQSRSRLSFDFFPGRPSASLFPIKTWRRLLLGALSHGGALGLSQYSDPGGLFILRSAIAHHLAATRGIVTDPAHVVVTSGIQEGIHLAARLFLKGGRAAALENPCYQGAAFAFEASGADLIHVPVDEDGLIASELPERPVSLLYMTPSHQYPTGHTLSASRRKDIVAWARRNGCYLLEDDYDSDFRYEGSPHQAVAALAPDCTIYLGTFSKSLGAGLRLGYMVVPPRLADAVRTAKTLLNNGNPWLDQAALAEFIRSGSYSAHLMRIRTQYRESRDALIDALQRYFGEAEISGEAGGLHLFWQLPQGVPEAATLEVLARKARVGIYSLASGGAFDAHAGSLTRRGVVLGYAALTPKQIEQGISRLSDAVDDTLDVEPGFVDQLMVHEPLRRPFPRPAHRRARTRPAPSFNQKPALRGNASLRAGSDQDTTREAMHTMPIVRGIYRYPVKGLSAQSVPGIQLEPGKPFPFDRVFALARPGVPVDQEDPKWAKKGLFIMLMLDEALAQVKTHLDPETMRFTVLNGNAQILAVDLATPDGRAEVEDFFHRLVPSLRGAPRLVRSREGHFMDKPDNVLSLINLATVRSLEDQWGVELDPIRFRANFYIDGARAWEEFDWIGSDIVIGDASFRVDRRNGRCGATNVNPSTGKRDLDIPASLRSAFGHKDLGIYLVTKKGGKVVMGDPVDIPRREPARQDMPPAPETADSARRYICRGCYYIYEEIRGHAPDGIAPGTPFGEVPAGFRCPDCGTDKSAFRPYVLPPAAASA